MAKKKSMIPKVYINLWLLLLVLLVGYYRLFAPGTVRTPRMRTARWPGFRRSRLKNCSAVTSAKNSRPIFWTASPEEAPWSP